jgi:hypothetical protein
LHPFKEKMVGFVTNGNAPFWGVSISGFRLALGSLLGHLRAFLALRFFGGLRRGGYFLLARHLGFSPVSG